MLFDRALWVDQVVILNDRGTCAEELAVLVLG